MEAREVTLATNDSHCDCNADDKNSSITEVKQVAVVSALKPKLPKLMLPKFKGEITQFHSFWDSNQSTIHTNSKILVTDNFNFKSAIRGPCG